MNHWYGYRYVERDLLSHSKFGTSADRGVHVPGTLGAAQIECVALLARRDRFVPSATLSLGREDSYSNAGVEWRAKGTGGGVQA